MTVLAKSKSGVGRIRRHREGRPGRVAGPGGLHVPVRHGVRGPGVDDGRLPPLRWLPGLVDAEPRHRFPVTLAPVFPGEQVGLGSAARDLEIARRTAATVRLEGGNDIVYQPLIRARLGMLDLAWFKDEVRYCQMPNGIVQDRVRQTGGRYSETTNFDFMMRMGVWTENLSLPAVLNECMLQSYAGVLRLFPNTAKLGPARFRNLRARGAFLVSAAWDGRQVSPVEISSEKGGVAQIANPWHPNRLTVMTVPGGHSVLATKAGAGVVRIRTKAGTVYRVARA